MIARVASSPVERTGLLILRIWLLPEQPRGASPRLAATITTTLDLSTRTEEHDALAGSVDEVATVVRRWIDAFASSTLSDDALTKP
jgi:hypothetical protein